MEGVGGHQHMFLPARERSKRLYSTMAEPQREPNDPSSSSLFIPEDEHYENEHARHRPRLALPDIRNSPARFAGDGLDYRRPLMSGVTSAARAPVIDLTDDDLMQESESSQGSNVLGPGPSRSIATATAQDAGRLPRFGRRDIISLDDSMNEVSEEETEPQGRSTGISSFERGQRGSERPRVSQLRRPYRTPFLRDAPANHDEDLEIVSERTLSRPQTMSRHVSPHNLQQRSLTPYPGDIGNAGPAPIDLTEDDDVVFMRENPREGGGINGVPPATTAGLGTRSVPAERNPLAGVAELLNGTHRLMQRMYDYQGPPDEYFNPLQGAPRHRDPLRRYRVPVPPLRDVPVSGFVPPVGMPGLMDYGMPAFDLGVEPIARPPSPKYSPPPSPGAGFIRNPGEDDVVVCPNCGDELAVSKDDTKSQVWVVTACGHAYCGTCAVNRALRKGKGKAKVTDPKEPRPFSKCVVDGCGKKCSSSRDMVHVFLGS
ncbi:hypothetical protein LTR78_000488 [Recurvomyces mirabilis]|uniref:RING-type domain-containing protein n=1 Tax=Recurvomyces mirabilis TaxID=574656 RepID=A0AAE0WX81_9PEZI|nr:hypothetical protein LTR78_000488 [Recurvomyces mirabilis]KAK5162143.1 hypothetical protein LTS14_000489 [Recurvomyces mirabilis]